MTKYIISISIFLIFFISSFTPALQVILMYWNGGVIALAHEITGIDTMTLAIPLNILLVVLSVIFYHISIKKWTRILFGMLTAFFINGLMAFIFEEYFIDTEYYLKQYFLTAILIGIILTISDFKNGKLEINKVD